MFAVVTAGKLDLGAAKAKQGNPSSLNDRMAKAQPFRRMASFQKLFLAFTKGFRLMSTAAQQKLVSM